MDAAIAPERPFLTPARCAALAAFLIVGSAVLRLIYLSFNCPLDLAPDEAHYWDWSRHLDWSYYSKGPGVAWLIRLSCFLFSDLSIWLTGAEMPAVRLPAVVCGGLLLASLYVLTLRISGRPPLALAAVAVALTIPAVAAGSSIMTIDSPYTCCWGWALVWMHRALFEDRWSGWWLAGLATGLGILFKYTMVLFVPSVALFLLFSPVHRQLLLSWRYWGFVALAGLSSLPIVVWNLNHEWVTFYHVQVLTNVEEPKITWLGPLMYVGVQCALWLVFWFIVWGRAMWAMAPWRPTTTLPQQYLWWMSAPMFCVFLAFGFKTGGGEPNWPVTAYLSGLVLGLIWLTKELQTATGWYRGITVGGFATAIFAGVLLTFTIHFSNWIHPLLTAFVGPPTLERPFPLRHLDPTLRLRGWQHLAAEVDDLRDRLRAQNEEPILAGSGWNLPGLIGFYCKGHPTVYSLGLALGDRHSQYDFWRPNPISDAEEFTGKTFLLIAPGPYTLHGFFDSVEAHPVLHFEQGQPVAGWYILVCRGFHGFGASVNPANLRSF
jgi:hypothetical protein